MWFYCYCTASIGQFGKNWYFNNFEFSFPWIWTMLPFVQLFFGLFIQIFVVFSCKPCIYLDRITSCCLIWYCEYKWHFAFNFKLHHQWKIISSYIINRKVIKFYVQTLHCAPYNCLFVLGIFSFRFSTDNYFIENNYNSMSFMIWTPFIFFFNTLVGNSSMILKGMESFFRDLRKFLDLHK
jgi:hypothetical protein